jgi:tetratricopeptide (TPR) repeat protein
LIGVAGLLSFESVAAAQLSAKSSESSVITSDSLVGEARQPTDLGSEAMLSRNISLYESGRYDECVNALRATLAAHALKKSLRPESIEQVQTYLAACLVASGKLEEADRVFAEAIRSNPQLRAPDSLIFPQSVSDRFLRVRERMLANIRQEEQNRMRDAERRLQQLDEKKKRDADVTRKLKALAEQETVVERSQRWLATVPFGVGQFQNHDHVAGGLFLGLETTLLGTAITAMVIDERLANKAQVPGVDVQELSRKRQSAFRVLVASTWGFGLVAVAGITHAHFRFVPERRSVRKRSLPPELAQSPSRSLLGEPSVNVALVNSDGQLGLQLLGRF